MNPVERGSHLLQVRRIAAVLEEQRLALGLADLGMIEIDVDDGRLLQFTVDLGFLEADQKRTAGDNGRKIARVPAIVFEKEILVLRKTQHGDRQVTIAAWIPAEEDWIFALQLAVLGRKDHHIAGVVTGLRPAPRDHAQVLVIYIVQ